MCLWLCLCTCVFVSPLCLVKWTCKFRGFFCCCPYLSWCSPCPLFPQVVANLKDAFFSRLDDAQSRVNDELDRAVDRWDNLMQLSWRLLAEAQDSAPGEWSPRVWMSSSLSQRRRWTTIYLCHPHCVRKCGTDSYRLWPDRERQFLTEIFMK